MSLRPEGQILLIVPLKGVIEHHYFVGYASNPPHASILRQ